MAPRPARSGRRRGDGATAQLPLLALLVPLLLALALLLPRLQQHRALAADDDERHRRHPVVVVAQGRSGSSFLSSWFNAHPRAFYQLEPCGMVYQKRIDMGDLTGARCAQLIRRLQRCDFSMVAQDRDQQPLIPEKAAGFTGWGHKKDLALCEPADVVVTKELRVGMLWATTWASEADGDRESAVSASAKHWDPDTKFVVLVRDPRAVLSSRQEGWPEPARSGTPEDASPNPRPWNGRSGFPYDQSLRSLCVEHAALRAHAASHARSTLLVEYEEVLPSPLDLAERVLGFAGLDLAPEVMQHVQNNTRGECEHEGQPFSLCRKLEQRVDDKWVSVLRKDKLDALLAIDECVDLIERFYSRREEL